MAMPSSMAIVLNSAAKQPAASMAAFTRWPMSCRCTWPGHELGERVGDGDDGPAALLVAHAVGPPEGAGPGHQPALAGRRAAQGIFMAASRYFFQFSGRSERTAAPACHISESRMTFSSASSFSW